MAQDYMYRRILSPRNLPQNKKLEALLQLFLKLSITMYFI